MSPAAEVSVAAAWAGVASGGFAVMFRLPPRLLPTALLCAVVGHAVRGTVIATGQSIELGTLAGATLIGGLAFIMARRERIPMLVLSVPAIIPMVPGVFAFRGMLGLLSIVRLDDEAAIQTALAQGAIDSLRAIFIVAAIAIGISSPGIVLRPLVQRDVD